MAASSDISENIEHDLINEIYGLVASPEEFDKFIHKIGNQLDTLGKENSQFALTIAEHITRASELLEAVTPWESSLNTELSRQLTNNLQVSMAIDSNGTIVDANSTAYGKYNISAGSNIKDLPLQSHDGANLEKLIGQKTNCKVNENSKGNVYRFKHLDSEITVLLTAEKYINPDNGELLAIVKTTEFGWLSHLEPILKNAFKLTNAEVAVLKLIVEGKKIDEIAEYRVASVFTIKTQLRSIFAKTNTHSQSECIKLIFGISLLHDRDQGGEVAKRLIMESGTKYYPTPETIKTLLLPNGKRLQYAIFGAENGPAILFYHCNIFGDTWSEEAVEAITQAGLRVIAPLRPGFGNTSLYDGEFSDPHVFAESIEALLDHENINAVSAVTMSSGFQNCLAVAKRIPKRIKGISATRPMLPAMSIADLEGLSGYNYLIPNSRISFRPALRFLCKAGFAFFQKVGTERFLRAFWRSSPNDVEWSVNPQIISLLEHSKKIHAKHGYLGTLGDIAYPEDWTPILENCDVPVRFVVGEDDQNLPWAAMRKFATKCENISIYYLPGPGRIVHHEHYGTLIKLALADFSAQPVS